MPETGAVEEEPTQDVPAQQQQQQIRVTCPTCEVLLEVQPAEGSRSLIWQVVTCTCGVKLKVGRLVNAIEAAAP